MSTDTQLIEQILCGKIELYRELVSRYKGHVFSVARKITRDEREAEDLSQEIFIKAYQSLHTFQRESSFSTWIYRIDVNKGLDWKKANQRRLFVEPLEGSVPNSVPLTEQFLLAQEEKEKVTEQIQHLPEIYERIIFYYYFDNLSYLEISKKLGISPKTVESRLYRAKKLLKENLVKEGLR